MSARADAPELLAVFAGGAVGAVLRTGLEEAFPPAPGAFPWTTWAVNVAGAAVLGLVVAWVRSRPAGWRLRRPLLGTGFCGALTTFSTLQLELLRLLDEDAAGVAAAYLLASVAAGLAVVAVAVRLTRPA